MPRRGKAPENKLRRRRIETRKYGALADVWLDIRQRRPTNRRFNSSNVVVLKFTYFKVYVIPFCMKMRSL